MQIAIRQVLQSKIPDHNVRIELIPIEWHRHIHEKVDPIMHKITLKSIPTIRLIENEYLADVLFYFSKDKGQQIIDNITNLFNTSYLNFMEKHPDFNGKIIILGYSLGGLITWDILAHQKTPNEDEVSDYQKLDVDFPKLEFKPHYFFGLGSPIGAVLTFRGQSPTLYRPEPDIHFENIFHPFDPLGYRIEPLFSDDFIDQPAVLVERSFPIGPSFSFPSMPSLPTGGLFSFFTSTNKQNEDNDDKVDDNKRAPSIQIEASDEEEEEEEEEVEEKKTSKYSVTSTIMHYFTTNTKTKNNTSQTDTRTADDIGIITWDPLKDERDPIVSFNNDDGLDSSSFDHLSVSSSNTLETRPTFEKRGSSSSRHLVEMLGIDGTKLDSKSGAKVAQDATVADDDEEKEEQGSHQVNVDALPGKRRMDHVLQPDSVMSMIANEYLVGLRAHFSYWTNKDFIWHMLRKIENRQE
ncbi:hypothetical protein K501DRAFT_239483 [Backusella circina FSU 941]|nr:hypothetical protein K501DRAFT_239483 [Backusella circina FSU 941]